jgi:hypothetical protein
MACELAPSAHSELCASNGACIAQQVSPPSHFEGLTFACDPEDAPGSRTGPFTPSEPAPRETGIAALELVNVIAQNEVGMIQLGASYLVADLPEGACLVDVVHDWDPRPSYVETDIQTRWEPSAAGFRLGVRSRRIEHEPLDESESAKGVSDVRSDACVSLAYEFTGEHFERVDRRSSKGPCPDFVSIAPGSP